MATTTETESSKVPTGDQGTVNAARPTTEWTIYGTHTITHAGKFYRIADVMEAKDAQLIVRAVNSYNAMLDALEHVNTLWTIDAGAGFDMEMSIPSPVGVVWQKVRAAIDQATTPNAHGNHVEQAPALEAKEA